MRPILTILVPNYNRPKSLYRLLASLYDSIDAAGAESSVRVVVVDDFSTAHISDSIQLFRGRNNFQFKTQNKKCGNAELAFLSAVTWIGTEYTWLLGNDDYVSVDAISVLLYLIRNSEYGFILLNPRVHKEITSSFVAPITSLSSSIKYKTVHDLFMDFGFVTSTTTFPSIFFRTAPLREFHVKNNLCNHAKVYSHTFSIYAALREFPGLFLADQIVGFTLNERLDEQAKLHKQAPHGISFYHQSLGLARLIDATSKAIGVPISVIAAAFEDETDKDTMTVHNITLRHFLGVFFLEQLTREQHNLVELDASVNGLSVDEIHFIRNVIAEINDPALWLQIEDAIKVYFSMKFDPDWKSQFFRITQARIRNNAKRQYLEESKGFKETNARKIFPATFETRMTRGTEADARGMPIDLLPKISWRFEADSTSLMDS